MKERVSFVTPEQGLDPIQGATSAEKKKKVFAIHSHLLID
jgi:hypothetical protein